MRLHRCCVGDLNISSNIDTASVEPAEKCTEAAGIAAKAERIAGEI